MCTLPQGATAYRRAEITLGGVTVREPFRVTLHAEIEGPHGLVRVPGFYDGGDVFRVRYLPESAGRYTFRTFSSVAALDGHTGAFEVGPAAPTDRGPVRTDGGFHFRHADGTTYHPIGTTAYAWTHQPDALQRDTLESLRSAPFTKIRMCLFPKHYQFNHNEPDRLPFERDEHGTIDFGRFDVRYWQQLERRLEELDEIGVQADLILFHPYDRWGLASMDADVDDAYLSYAAARLSAFPHVWWSLANEFDLMKAKSPEDWERFAAILQRDDPTGHLMSIHNCLETYDHDRPWVTHVSIQRIDLYKTAEMVTEWRERWGKPVVVDECGYEGDIDQGWGNLTGEELIRRAWEGTVRGGYVGHGETYLAENEVLWWSKGGELKGTSPDRFAFLRQVLEEAPGPLEPVPGDWDAPRAGIEGKYYLSYYGFNRPRFRTFSLDPAVAYFVDIIDTWGMTVETLPEPRRGTFRVDLPGRPYMAVRLRAQ
ncbi:MAG TPA: DUF5605 domain-containing protein [Trueperaceae bacterium]|nr:DUF5605 domain-containing protein [Trueperaceae bacterium]